MPLKQIYRKDPPYVVSYDWTDIISSHGFILYDGLNASDSGGDNYILMRSAEAGNIIGSVDGKIPGDNPNKNTVATGTGSGGNPATFLDIDFDSSQLQLPINLEGYAKVKVAFVEETGGSNQNFKATVLLRKWDGSSETEIVSKSTSTGALGTSAEKSYVFDLLVPKTHFKTGEQIRLTVQFSSESSNDAHLGHDPSDAASAVGGGFTAGNSRLILALPFKIDT